MKFVLTDITTGFCVGIVDYSVTAITSHMVVNNIMYVEVEDSVKDDIYLNTYYKNNEFKQLPPKPSQYHIWDLASESWIEPEGYLQTIQTDGNKQINQLAGQKILSKYPIYKQLNIARTDEASAMYSWIDNIRDLSNIATANITQAVTQEEITAIVDNFKIELGNIA